MKMKKSIVSAFFALALLLVASLAKAHDYTTQFTLDLGTHNISSGLLEGVGLGNESAVSTVITDLGESFANMYGHGNACIGNCANFNFEVGVNRYVLSDGFAAGVSHGSGSSNAGAALQSGITTQIGVGGYLKFD